MALVHRLIPMASPAKPPPLHEKIRSDIEQGILSGTLRPGDKLPSEAELMEHYGCSRMTVNKAISVIANAGLVERRKRAGTIVARRTTESVVLDVPDLRRETEARGQTYEWRLTARSVLKTTKANATPLGLPPGHRVLHIIGSHHADGLGFAFEDRYVNIAAVPEIEQLDCALESPGIWLLHHIPWTEAEHRIKAAPASPECARVLAIPEGSPCLEMDRQTWRGDERVTYVKQHFPAGRHEMIARFGPARA